MKFPIRPILVSATVAMAATAIAAPEYPDTALYREPLRPQYHFTPAHRWIGDPCGLVYADSLFHAYSW